ncbi:selenocysteine lyase/cysteine desulfurase [Ewingella americana]
MSFPLERVRNDFPLLSREVNGQPLAYLDSAASAQKPRQVIERELEFYQHGYAAVHRGIHTLSAEATEQMGKCPPASGRVHQCGFCRRDCVRQRFDRSH